MTDSNSPLGKGLSALISEEAIKEGTSYIPDLDINKIIPNPKQPRLELSPESLIELADSIREHGIIEPLIVSKPEQGTDKYTLVAGERRWRAAQIAQLKTVPIVIKETTPLQMLELAIIENIQRKDLNPLEEALAFQQLNDDYNIPVREIAKKMGISRPAVSNKLRLLQLPDRLKEALINEEISEGHARALLGLNNDSAMEAAMRIVIKDTLSVRGTEELVRKLGFEEKKNQNMQAARKLWSPRAVEIKDVLAKRLRANVKLTRSSRGGKLVIPFKSDEELEEIYSKIFDESITKTKEE